MTVTRVLLVELFRLVKIAPEPGVDAGTPRQSLLTGRRQDCRSASRSGNAAIRRGSNFHPRGPPPGWKPIPSGRILLIPLSLLAFALPYGAKNGANRGFDIPGLRPIVMDIAMITLN